jgi:formate hydrogenlyase transcriptional activator
MSSPLRVASSKSGAKRPALAEGVAAEAEMPNVRRVPKREGGAGKMVESADQGARMLAEIAQATATQRTLEDLYRALARALKPILPFDGIMVTLADLERGKIRIRLGEGEVPAEEARFEYPLDEFPEGELLRTRTSLVMDDVERESRWPVWRKRLLAVGMRSTIYLPLFSAGRFLGALAAGTRAVGTYATADLRLLEPAAAIVATAVDNALTFEQLTVLKNRLAQEKLNLEEEIRSERGFHEIVGESKALQRVLEQVRTVAPTDSAVLILGETGTGKELIARALHAMSGRKERAFVKMNCAAIPTGLLESELFGHEKGAFTGAIAQKLGRYELADQGTLFLDEVGDIPLELQPKLLRVLQEKEFERLGSTRTLKVDVRLVAATNQDLDRMILEKKFRSDLFYRLNVFPVRIPSLRGRREDIPPLVRHFVKQASKKLKKDIRSIPSSAMDALTRAPWPGNIRELENFIERAVILSPGSSLSLPAGELAAVEIPSEREASNVLQEGERDTILRALRESKWVVSGPEGAAAKLGVKRSTLQYKMKKFGLLDPQ